MSDQAGLVKLLADTGLGVPTLGTGMAAGEDGLTFAHHDPAIRAQAVARDRGAHPSGCVHRLGRDHRANLGTDGR